MKRKTRAHHILFVNDSPFKPQVVKSKKDYQRKPKHGNQHRKDADLLFDITE